MTVSNICILGTIAVYLVGMLIIGFRCARKNESSADFYLGGRKLGPLVTAMSAEASDMSSYLLMGLPGLAYLSGVADVGWTAIGLAVGTYLNWLFTALRLRRYTQETGSFTIPQFFSRRFRDDNNILAVLAAVIIIIHSLYCVRLRRLREAVLLAVRYELYDRDDNLRSRHSRLYHGGRILRRFGDRLRPEHYHDRGDSLCSCFLNDIGGRH